MKNLITLFAVLLCVVFSEAQTITSKNVLEYYARTQASLLAADPASATVMLQVGNNNLMEVTDIASSYIALSQIGDNNTTYLYNTNNHRGNAEINIIGSGNYVEILGSNSISDGMKININANDTNIFMKNY